MSDAPDLQRQGTSTSERVNASGSREGREGVYLLSGGARVANDLKGVCYPFLCGLLGGDGPG